MLFLKRYDSEVRGFTGYRDVRRGLLRLIPMAAAAPFLRGQSTAGPSAGHGDRIPTPGVPDDTRLPNGKLQREEILKADYDLNLRDARELIDAARSFELDLEKSDRYVLSLSLLKKLDDIDKITKRLRNRMRH
jgi:hypothetical protein